MPTIAMSKKYQELTYRHLKLVQLYSVMSELRLHTNKRVNVDTSKYYHEALYVGGDYGPFLTASLESMMQVFYIELDGFIGAYWDKPQNCVKQRSNEQGSLAAYLYAYLYDGRRLGRKKSAQKLFEELIRQNMDDLEMMHELRYKLAHFKKLNERNIALAPGDAKIREILNKLAEVLFLLGFQKWNSPHYMEQDNDSSNSTQKVVDRLVLNSKRASTIRKSYTKARTKWFSN